MKRTVTPALVITTIVLSACGGQRQQSSRLLDDPPPSGQQGSADGQLATLQLDESQYFKGKSGPIATPTLTDAFYAKFPKSCTEGEEGSGDAVAVTVDGQCKVVTRAEAQTHFQKLAEAMARYGVDINEEVSAAVELSASTPGELVAEPKVDLGTLVTAQLDTQRPGITDPNAPAFTLLENNRYGAAVGPRNWGSDQFGLTAGARAFVQAQAGVGFDAGLNLDAKVFGSTMSVLLGELRGSGFDGNRGTANGRVAVFGTNLINKTLEEPEYARSGNVATISRSHRGAIRFSLGPIPFNVTWIVSVNGGAPWQITARPTGVEASFTPNLQAAASLEGGPSIVVASAGVGGTLTIVNTALENTIVGNIQVREGAPNLCYRVSSALVTSSLLGGRMYAFGVIGWPDRTVFGRPLGWRGELEFVNWTGVQNTLPIFSSGADLTCSPVI